MTDRMSPRWTLAASVLLLGGCLSFVFWFALAQPPYEDVQSIPAPIVDPASDKRQEAPAPVAPERPPAVVPEQVKEALFAAAPPRRLPVAGLKGYSVILAEDGSSFLEAPDGGRSPLSEPGDPATISEDAVTQRVAARLTVPRPRNEVGRLVVLDKGIVDVPKDAVVTFQGPDKVVARESDGVFVTHYADGRIERSKVAARPAEDGSAPQP